MATTIAQRGTMFSPEVVSDLMNKVQGHSSIAKLSGQTPIPFNGAKEFTFNMDSEIDIVAESGKKSNGGITLEPVTIVPIKFEYGARVSDEFMYATEEEQINILKAFNDGFAKKVAKGFDIASMHGLNPRTLTASSVIGTNNFDSAITQLVAKTANIDTDIESAIALVEGSDANVTGLAGSTDTRQALANLKTTANERLYPELAWGGSPDTLNGLAVDFNKTVAAKTSAGKRTDLAIVGDFEESFKWGYAKEIPLKVIEYGDPDGTGRDLSNYNEVYLRCEVYLGWGILNKDAFAVIHNTTA